MVESLVGQSSPHNLAWYPLLCRVVTPGRSPAGDIVHSLVLDVSPHSALNWESPEPNADVAPSPPPLPFGLPGPVSCPLSAGFPASAPAGLSVPCAHQVPGPEAGRSSRVTVAVVDTFVWQALASVAIPGFTINRVCAASLYILSSATRWPLAVRKWTTTALGLLAIPVIIHPIDRWVRPPAPEVAHSRQS